VSKANLPLPSHRIRARLGVRSMSVAGRGLLHRLDGAAPRHPRGVRRLQPRRDVRVPSRVHRDRPPALRAHRRARALAGLVRRREDRRDDGRDDPSHRRARRDGAVRRGHRGCRRADPSPPRPAHRDDAPPAGGAPRRRRAARRAVGVGGGDLRALRVRPRQRTCAPRGPPARGATADATAARRAAARRSRRRPRRGDARDPRPRLPDVARHVRPPGPVVGRPHPRPRVQPQRRPAAASGRHR
jgi:hypothetical protein